ncbi:cyanophycinase [Micromonospora olivasterospora]|uniref:Cyanophycinase n=2 Tax=Micromonospora olivasterospora TaxID=1880 RepID=A0A562IH95_MICOL|nr:cyanophycinase [Micromonospora olivasterospora]
MLVGGALDDGNAAVYGEFVRQAGGAQARIGVLSASSAVPHSSANAVAKVLKAYGAGEVTWIPPVTAKRDGSGDDPSNAALAASMTGFFLTGGDQFRYVQSMVHADGTDGAVLRAVRQRFLAGAPVAGTSAGMQILAGRDMVTGGTSYPGVRDGAQPGVFDTDDVLGYWPAGGFGFFTSGLVDTHFDARGRNSRSIRLAADTGHDRVYGVGEDTALVVTGAGTAGESLRVVGTTGVSVLDLRSARVGLAGGHWSIDGVRWSYLTDGDSYDPARWRVAKGAGSSPAVPRSRPAGRRAWTRSARTRCGTPRSTWPRPDCPPRPPRRPRRPAPVRRGAHQGSGVRRVHRGWCGSLVLHRAGRVGPGRLSRPARRASHGPYGRS